MLLAGLAVVAHFAVGVGLVARRSYRHPITVAEAREQDKQLYYSTPNQNRAEKQYMNYCVCALLLWEVQQPALLAYKALRYLTVGMQERGQRKLDDAASQKQLAESAEQELDNEIVEVRKFLSEDPEKERLNAALAALVVSARTTPPVVRGPIAALATKYFEDKDAPALHSFGNLPGLLPVEKDWITQLRRILDS